MPCHPTLYLNLYDDENSKTVTITNSDFYNSIKSLTFDLWPWYALMSFINLNSQYFIIFRKNQEKDLVIAIVKR